MPVTATLQYSPVPSAGSITADVIDNNGNPSSVIDANLDFTVKGALTVSAGGMLDGKFKLTLLGDEHGGQFDAAVISADVDITGDGSFPYVITIPANTLPRPAVVGGARPRQVMSLYLLVTYVTAGGADTDLTAIAELGTFLFS